MAGVAGQEEWVGLEVVIRNATCLRLVLGGILHKYYHKY